MHRYPADDREGSEREITKRNDNTDALDDSHHIERRGATLRVHAVSHAPRNASMRPMPRARNPR